MRVRIHILITAAAGMGLMAQRITHLFSCLVEDSISSTIPARAGISHFIQCNKGLLKATMVLAFRRTSPNRKRIPDFTQFWEKSLYMGNEKPWKRYVQVVPGFVASVQIHV